MDKMQTEFLQIVVIRTAAKTLQEMQDFYYVFDYFQGSRCYRVKSV